MPSPMTNDKAKSNKDRHPIRVFRRGAIAASVWKRQTSAGFEYLDYSLSRSWKLKNGEREGYSQNFFENNADAIVEVVQEACRFIRNGIASDQQSDTVPGREEPSIALDRSSARIPRTKPPSDNNSHQSTAGS